MPIIIPAVGGAEGDALASIVIVAVQHWRPPADLAEELLAELPVSAVQPTLAGAAAATVESAVCGWHYSNDAPPPPASAIVRTGGPLEHLVGERVRVVAQTVIGPASVVVVVLDEQPFDDALDEDISLSRAAFSRIASLAADAVLVHLEVMG